MQTLIQQKQQEFLILIDEALLKDLFEVDVYVPQLKEKILKSSKWAFCMKESNTDSKYPKDSTTPISSYKDEKLGQLNMSEIFEAEKAIILYQEQFVSSPMFEDLIYEKTLGQFATVELDDMDVNIKTKIIDIKEVYLDEFFQYFTPILTLPPYQEIFDIKDDTPDWLWDIITQYQKWTWKMRKELGIDSSYMQIGGHPCLAQTEPQCYVAQINNNIGDAGSVVLEYCTTKNSLAGYIDMS